mmetsp:Transcript_57901/g.147002  ORF Transcript_57901/g.147002 Transcript_57901/m.147002 type:complete len:399 (-) Transcript_57901:117-1313(-)
MALPKGPAQELLENLDSVFGPEYFEHGRLLITVARDVAGAMKVAHRLQSRINESLGAMVEIIFEHVKHELWSKLHEATATVGLHKGAEVPECQVTHIPDGIRTNPYQRERLPTLEVLLLWEDITRATRGHVLYSISHPASPSVEQVDEIFAQIEPYFAKRWVCVELSLGEPIKGVFDEDLAGEEAEHPPHDPHVGPGVGVTLLACHAYGFAREQTEYLAPHVRHCQPLAFRSISDDAGRAKICFLPAEVNKVQVAETESFHGTEVLLPKADIRTLDQGPTVIKVKLTPKALATITVNVFAQPRTMPRADETDGIIDWAKEDLEPVLEASVEVTQMKDGEAPLRLVSFDEGVTFVAEDGFLPEGAVHLVVHCPGYETEERPIMLLVGLNEFYVPLRRVS